MGYLSLAAHAHLDALHLSLWHKKRAVLIDPGTGSYRDDDGARSLLADWASHNGPCPVPPPPRPRRVGKFLWKGRHADPLLTKLPSGPVEAQVSLGDGTWRRMVEILPMEGGWSVVDTREKGQGPWRVRWTVAPDIGVRQDGAGFLLEREGIRIRVRIKEPEGISSRTALVKTICSPRYGIIKDTLAIEWQGEAPELRTMWEVL
jgi:hypothetical protein